MAGGFTRRLLPDPNLTYIITIYLKKNENKYYPVKSYLLPDFPDKYDDCTLLDGSGIHLTRIDLGEIATSC